MEWLSFRALLTLENKLNRFALSATVENEPPLSLSAFFAALLMSLERSPQLRAFIFLSIMITPNY